MKYLYYVCIAVLASLIIFFFVLNKSRARAAAAPAVPSVGEIQILNGCGEKGAAGLVSDLLRDKGFDVKEIGNAADWNYRETIVAGRKKDMRVAEMVGRALKTGNVVRMRNGDRMFDVTVFVGRDYLKLVRAL
jgi:hypothetical protein